MSKILRESIQELLLELDAQEKNSRSKKRKVISPFRLSRYGRRQLRGYGSWAAILLQWTELCESSEEVGGLWTLNWTPSWQESGQVTHKLQVFPELISEEMQTRDFHPLSGVLHSAARKLMKGEKLKWGNIKDHDVWSCLCQRWSECYGAENPTPASSCRGPIASRSKNSSGKQMEGIGIVVVPLGERAPHLVIPNVRTEEPTDTLVTKIIGLNPDLEIVNPEDFKVVARRKNKKNKHWDSDSEDRVKHRLALQEWSERFIYLDRDSRASWHDEVLQCWNCRKLGHSSAKLHCHEVQ